MNHLVVLLAPWLIKVLDSRQKKKERKNEKAKGRKNLLIVKS